MLTNGTSVLPVSMRAAWYPAGSDGSSRQWDPHHMLWIYVETAGWGGSAGVTTVAGSLSELGGWSDVHSDDCEDPPIQKDSALVLAQMSQIYSCSALSAKY